MTILGIPKKTNFLLLDDFELIRAVPRKELISLGFTGNIFEADNGRIGIDLLSKCYGTENQIGYILSDLVMPEMTGHEFLSFVRKDERFKNLPFIMLTTESEKGLVVKSIQLGVSNFLLKPFTPDEFHQKLELCWKKHNK
jgi:two-component system chemotaxis response regulator CheY